MMNTDFIILGILFIIPCVLYFIFPDFFLTFGSKWRYKDATPSDGARFVGSICAVIGIVLGAGMIVYGIFREDINSFFTAITYTDYAETGIYVY